MITTKTESLLHAGTIVNDDEWQHGVGESTDEDIEVDSKKNYWDKHFDLWSK